MKGIIIEVRVKDAAYLRQSLRRAEWLLKWGRPYRWPSWVTKVLLGAALGLLRDGQVDIGHRPAVGEDDQDDGEDDDPDKAAKRPL